MIIIFLCFYFSTHGYRGKARGNAKWLMTFRFTLLHKTYGLSVYSSTWRYRAKARGNATWLMTFLVHLLHEDIEGKLEEICLVIYFWKLEEALEDCPCFFLSTLVCGEKIRPSLFFLLSNKNSIWLIETAISYRILVSTTSTLHLPMSFVYLFMNGGTLQLKFSMRQGSQPCANPPWLPLMTCMVGYCTLLPNGP